MHRQEVVERLAGGHFIDLLVSNLERVTEEVLTTGNTGTVSVTLKVSTPDKQAVDPLATVETSIKASPPKKDPVTTGFFYHDEAFQLRPSAQQEFPNEIYSESEEETR